MTTDKELLRKYAYDRSESAFTELVGRHVGMVYAAALRETHGDVALAQDISQGVFTELAKNAARLCAHPAPAGWLYTCVRGMAANARRAEARRRRREQEAHNMNQLVSPASPEAVWRQIQPVLDDAMHELNESERAAVVLRFFENRTHQEVGLALGWSESAARKRVDRAIEKLRGALGRRGITSVASGLSAALALGAVASPPSGLAASIAAGALSSASSTASSPLTLLKLATMTKLQIAITGALIIGGAATLLIVQSGSQTRQRKQAAAPAPIAQDPRPSSGATSALWRRVSAMDDARAAARAASVAEQAWLADLRKALFAPADKANSRILDDPAHKLLSAIPAGQRAPALGLIIEALHDPNQQVCFRAVWLVPLLGPQGDAAHPALCDLIRYKSNDWPDVAGAALVADAQVRSESDVIPELVTASMAGGDKSRQVFAMELPLVKSQIKDSDAVFATALQPFLYSPDASTRLAAAQALAQLSGPKDRAVVSELTASLATGGGSPAEVDGLRASLGALWKMGPEARDATPALLELAKQRPELADGVNMVLKVIMPDALKGVGVPTPLQPLESPAGAVQQNLASGAWTMQQAIQALSSPEWTLPTARALADFGAGAAEALPALRQAFDRAAETNLPAAYVIGSTIERLDPRAPKPLLLVPDILPALEAVQAEIQRAGNPEWTQALQDLPQRVPIGIAVRHQDVRNLAAEFARIDPKLRTIFESKLLDMDAKFAAILKTDSK